jgi:uncharacterized protein YjbJ (UPF0337 family)
MDKDTIKGKVKDAAGRVERQAGEWTGRKDMEAEGAARQAEGKAQKGLGKLKDLGRDIKARMERGRDDRNRPERDRERDEKVA